MDMIATGLSPQPGVGGCVLEIGRQIEATYEAADAIERAIGAVPQHEVGAWKRAERALDLMYDRRRALGELALTLPARSLADVAVHLVLTMDSLARLSENQSKRWELERGIEKAYRTLAGVLPVVAAAAGVSLTEIGGDEHALSAQGIPA